MVHIVILNISALYNFICIIAKYIQPTNRDWMENVWRQKKRKFFSGMSFSISMIAFYFWGNKRQIWTIDDRKLWMGATLLKSPSLCLSEWIGGRPRKDLHKSQFSHLNEKALIQLALCLWMYKYNCAGNVKLQREFGGRLGKEYIMDTFSHPRLSMKLLLSRFLAVEEIYWGKSFASWIFIRGLLKIFSLSF